MPNPYVPCQRLTLRGAGYDEAWLQRTIMANPSILGLGDLKPVGREVRQHAGGRLDFVFLDPDSQTMFEIEVMLGPTDESHIIRTLEYWDIETRRWPNFEHRAVLVAEEITNRFFNVIWLLNRSVPIIAIKLDTLTVDGKLTLNFTKILDIYETPEGREPDQIAGSSRQAWQEYAGAESFSVFEKCIALLSRDSANPRITYNDGHIAIGGAKRNFAWFTPRKRDKHCMVNIRVGDANTESTLQKLQSLGLDAYRMESDTIRIRLLAVDLDKNQKAVSEALQVGIAEGGGL
ncbi:MAG: hypothetical protein HYX28_06845 [Candidatus Koribacter versatilis]|uniref:DUF5655 domain-containing protein n=1 Tax=Candidatus Korobacter versatilis TaxID=658062 RepID=A0A932A8G2_9BACT|nr:hypothetical protein [Candidatus Koribacter versatilis]